MTLQAYSVEVYGLDLHEEELTQTRWVEIGRELVERRELTTWALVDWLLCHRGEWGDRYTLAMQVTGYSYQYLQQLYSVGVLFPRDRRDPELTVGHHRAVASLGDRDAQLRFLQQAKTARWNANTLFEQVAACNAAQHNGSKRPQRRHHKQVKCPGCGLVFPATKHKI